MDSKFFRPIFRWAGGKNWLLKDLQKFLPSSFNNYHEPFLGGGSIFFNMNSNNKAFLSDCNSDLINAYSQTRDNLEELINLLKKFKNTKDEYYRIRGTQYSLPIEKAAQFIYLNRTCYNGIYRVNYKGEFNVPYGFKKYRKLFEFERFRKASELLKRAELLSYDFELSLENIKEGDFVFLDPPYTVSHIKNGFLKYNENIFSWVFVVKWFRTFLLIS